MGENKNLIELGSKQRAGRILSEYLRGIGTEKTELITDPSTGKTKVVSKAEALARQIWEKAISGGVDGGISLDWTKLLLDRVEGKPGVNDDAAQGTKPTAADRVSEMNKKRINGFAEEEDASGLDRTPAAE